MATTSDDLKARWKAAAGNCERWLSHPRVAVPDRLQQLTQMACEDSVDVYGNDGDVAALEQEVADLLGKPAAVFMPTGIMAQQSVLRVYADRSGSDRVACTACPTC